jgi:hypothetical protein
MGRAPKPYSRREQELHIQADFINAVRERGGAAYKLTCSGRRGFPDVMVVNLGHVTFVEIKQRTGHLTKMQEFCHRELTKNGAEVVVVYGRQCAFELLRMMFNRGDRDEELGT